MFNLNFFYNLFKNKVNLNYLLEYDFNQACSENFEDIDLLKNKVIFFRDILNKCDKKAYILVTKIDNKEFFIRKNSKDSYPILESINLLEDLYIKDINKYSSYFFDNSLKFSNRKYSLLFNNNGFFSLFSKKNHVLDIKFSDSISKFSSLFLDSTFELKKYYLKDFIKKELNKNIEILNENYQSFKKLKKEQEKSLLNPSCKAYFNSYNGVIEYNIENHKNDNMIEFTNEHNKNKFYFENQITDIFKNMSAKKAFTFRASNKINGLDYVVEESEVRAVCLKNNEKYFNIFNNSCILKSLFKLNNIPYFQIAFLNIEDIKTKKSIFNGSINKKEDINLLKTILYLQNRSCVKMVDVKLYYTNFSVLYVKITPLTNKELEYISKESFVKFFSKYKLKESISDF